MSFFLNILAEFWGALAAMAPYLLFGFFVAGVLSVLVSPELVQRHLGGRGMWPVVKAALFGVPLPLCSCGVIPVSVSLRRSGASRGATTAFLISTPQTGVDSFMVTLSMLGPVFAIFRPVVALVSGIVGGGLVDLFDGQRDAERQRLNTGCDDRDPALPRRNKLIRALSYGFQELPRDIAKPLLAGLAISAGIAVFMPDHFVEQAVGSGIGAMLVMMALGIPLYVCATASVPIAAAMMAKGASAGAAMVFLMTGPATNAAALATVWKSLGRRSAVIYLLSIAACALGAGLLLDYAFAVTGATHWHMEHEMLPAVFRHGAAVVLLGVLFAAVLRTDRPTGTASGGADERIVKMRILGMTCSHCAATVQRALAEVRGVTSSTVDLKSGVATVAGAGCNPADLKAAVERAGYEVEGTRSNLEFKT